MKYALILTSDLKKKDWLCYVVTGSLSGINSLACYNPTIIKLPKSQYKGNIRKKPLFIHSCVTGHLSEFRIVEINNLNLKGTFNVT